MADKSFGAHAPASPTYDVVYTCPASTVAYLVSAHVSNVDGAVPALAYLRWNDTSASTSYYLLNGISIPAGSSLEGLSKTKLLEAGDTLSVSSSTSGDIDFTFFLSEEAV